MFFIRLARSRTIAQVTLAHGHVRIDGRRVGKPSDEVKAGSIIALPVHGQVRVLRVLSLPVRRGPPAEARSHYAEIDEGGGAA